MQNVGILSCDSSINQSIWKLSVVTMDWITINLLCPILLWCVNDSYWAKVLESVQEINSAHQLLHETSVTLINPTSLEIALIWMILWCAIFSWCHCRKLTLTMPQLTCADIPGNKIKRCHWTKWSNLSSLSGNKVALITQAESSCEGNPQV